MSETQYYAIDKIKIVQGDDFYETYQFQDANGDAIDLTDYTIESSIKEDDTDATALLTATTAITDAANGYFTIKYTNTQTDTLTLEKAYKYDIQLITPTGIKKTYVKGAFIVTFQIT